MNRKLRKNAGGTFLSQIISSSSKIELLDNNNVSSSSKIELLEVKILNLRNCYF